MYSIPAQRLHYDVSQTNHHHHLILEKKSCPAAAAAEKKHTFNNATFEYVHPFDQYVNVSPRSCASYQSYRVMARDEKTKKAHSIYSYSRARAVHVSPVLGVKRKIEQIVEGQLIACER